MSTLINRILVGWMVMAGLSQAWSFSMHGPKEVYHIEPLGYITDYQWAPKNLDDEYRLNIPVLYYSLDPEFLSYFGSNGIAAIDAAASILNNLTNANEFTTNLTEFPLESWSVNYSAQALGLFDLKSCALEVLVERYGLADPEEFAWTLRNRVLPPGAQCPQYEYTVIKRNFDPITLAPSSYVNGNLFSYQIFEFCPGVNQAIAEEYLVDPLGTELSAVSAGKIMFAISTYQGYFHQTLTRDDAGGIRYLLSTNNLNWETTPVDSFVYNTNTTQPVLLFPSNLQLFAEQSMTNDAGTLAGLYPGLVVTGTSNYFVNVIQTNVTAYLTNQLYAPADAPLVIAFRTNYTTNVATRYVHTYANVYTNSWSPGCTFTLMTTNIGPAPYLPADSGVLLTNITFSTVHRTNCVSGDFWILPTNICDYLILSTQLTQLVKTTNFLTNTFLSYTLVDTNNTTGSNQVQYFEYSDSIINYFTNNILVARPVTCPAQITSLFEGIGKVRWERRDYDSLLGQFFVPVTNDFAMTEVTNFHRLTRSLERAIGQPDILFSADDIVTDPASFPIITPTVSRQVPNYVTPTNINVLGPGTIQPSASFTFSKVGPLYLNLGPQFIDEASATLDFIWGSFDGTTNPPVVYPDGTDLMSLEYLMVFQMTNPTARTNGVFLLPDGSVGTPYNGGGFQLAAIGGLTPYTWTVAAGSGLPPGFTLSSDGWLAGTPGAAGIYDISIRLKDAANRSIVFPFTLTVSP